MKFIKINKFVLLIAFFMPFMEGCGVPTEERIGGKISQPSKGITDYLIYPTKRTVSGFGLACTQLRESISDITEVDIMALIAVAFICAFLGLILSHLRYSKALYYLSLVNLLSFVIIILVFIVFIILDNSDLAMLFEFFLWGFWLTTILSALDFYLITKWKAA